MPVLTKTASSFINGTWVEGSGAFVSRYNPADPEQVVTSYHQGSSAELAQAIQAAAAASTAWDELGILARGRLLTAAAAAIRDRAEEIAAVMTAEHGKTIAESRMEVEASADTFDYHGAAARNPIGTEFPSSNPALPNAGCSRGCSVMIPGAALIG